MASPFSVFRKNQNYWMAALVVIAIASFIVAPAMEQVISGSYSALRSNRSRIVSWRGGSINEQHARRLQQIHGLSQAFLRRLAGEVIARGGIPKVPGFEMTSQQNFTLGLNEYGDLLSVIQTKLFAERAREAGITVGRETVDFYLRQLTDRRIDDAKYKELFRETTQGNLSHFELVGYLQDELAARLYMDTLDGGLASQRRLLTTPGQNWQYFQKFNRRAKIETYPVLVSEFTEKAKAERKPTEQDLRQLYEEGKDRVPLSTSALAGFRRRHAANIEFVSANFDEHLKAAAAQLGEEEILNEYNKRVAAGRYRVPVTKQEQTGTSVANPEEGDAPSPERSHASDEVSESANADASGESQAESPSSELPSSDPGTSDPGTSDPGTSDNGTSDTPQDPPASSEGDGQAFSVSPSALRFISTQDPVADTKPTSETESPATSDPELASPNQIELGEIATASESTESPTTSADAQVTPPTGDSLEAILSGNPPNSDSGSAIPPATSIDIGQESSSSAPVTEMRVQTLDEVREELTRDMVSEPTRQKLQASLTAIVEKMQNYSDENQIYRRSLEAKDPTATKPEAVDLQALADAHGLLYGKTGLVDAESVMNLPIGRSRIQNMSTFPQVVMTPALPLYAPGNSQLFDLTGMSTFVFWKVEERPEFTPSFDEVRSEVEAVWYQQRARDFAREKAESIQKLVQSVEDNPWTAALSEPERALVVSPNPFTWMTSSQFSRGMPSITFVDRLDTVGDEFMRSVFQSSDGSVVVAPNEPQTIFYVVRVVETIPKIEDLQRLFALLPNQMDWQTMAFLDNQRVRSDWFPQIEKDLDVAWERRPSQLEQE